MVVWVWSVGVAAVVLRTGTGLRAWLAVARGLVEAGVCELVEGWVEECDGAGLTIMVVNTNGCRGRCGHVLQLFCLPHLCLVQPCWLG